MKYKNQNGQTIVILLIYMVIAIIVATASIALVINSARNTNKIYQGTTAVSIAESGIETAMIKLLRNPEYTSETIDVGNGQAVVSVTGTDPKTIVSQGTVNDHTRTVEVIVNTANNVLSIVSWREI